MVASTLLHLDDEFDEVGFGSWMPFRYPDQWLMFVGVMTGLFFMNAAGSTKRMLDFNANN